MRLMLSEMQRSAFLCLMGLLCACAQPADNRKDQAESSEHRGAEAAVIARAKADCSKFENPPVDVGISAYETCLGQHANLTHPANPELCTLARSAMSEDGTCLLAE